MAAKTARRSCTPVAEQLRYFELKLEYPDLEPSGHGDRFFPDAIPYELDDVPRVFYRRPALAPSADEPEAWKLACATTHELVGFDSLPVDGPSLVTEGASGTTLVVDGTIAGDATTSYVASYTVPELTVDDRSETEIRSTVNGTEYSVSIGERRRIRLAEQCVQPVSGRQRTNNSHAGTRCPLSWTARTPSSDSWCDVSAVSTLRPRSRRDFQPTTGSDDRR